MRTKIFNDIHLQETRFSQTCFDRSVFHLPASSILKIQIHGGVIGMTVSQPGIEVG